MPFSIWKAAFKDFFVVMYCLIFKSQRPKVPTMKGNVSVAQLVGQECKKEKENWVLGLFLERNLKKKNKKKNLKPFYWAEEKCAAQIPGNYNGKVCNVIFSRSRADERVLQSIYFYPKELTVLLLTVTKAPSECQALEVCCSWTWAHFQAVIHLLRCSLVLWKRKAV